MKHHLKGLEADCTKLEAIVTKYAKIHGEGPGRRMLFTVMESGGLTDLRRRIGLHEQMLEMWYMTLIYGSLRRIEGGQENLLDGQQDILKAIDAIKALNPNKLHKVQQSLRQGDIKPLERELQKSGLGAKAVDTALCTAVDYVDAAPLERIRMESQVRASTVRPAEPDTFSHGSHPEYPSCALDEHCDKMKSSHRFPEARRRRSTTARRRPPHLSFDDPRYHSGSSSSDEEFAIREWVTTRRKGDGAPPSPSGKKKDTTTHKTSNNVEISHRDPRPRSSSYVALPHLPKNTIVVPVPGSRDRHKHHRRSASQQDQHQQKRNSSGHEHRTHEVTMLQPPSPAPHHHRSHSSSSLNRPDEADRLERSSSTHSYYRERPRPRSER